MVERWSDFRRGMVVATYYYPYDILIVSVYYPYRFLFVYSYGSFPNPFLSSWFDVPHISPIGGLKDTDVDIPQAGVRKRSPGQLQIQEEALSWAWVRIDQALPFTL